MNPAILAELEKGARVFPVLRVDWESRGHALGTDYVAPGGVILPDVPIRSKASAGGWGPVRFGPGVRGSTLASARSSVRIEDIRQDLAALLETYAPRGSRARISWASLGVIESDWETIFDGIVDDWRSGEGGTVDVILKTDERELRSPAPKPQFQRASAPTASDPAIYGTTIPLLLGIHDSFRITVRGQVRALNVRRDDSTATSLQLYAASLGNLTSVERVYFDGELQTGLAFETIRGLYGGVYQTLIGIERDDAPEPEVVVSFDAIGPDTAGGITGPTLLNPVAELRTFLEEYTFRDNQTGIYVGPHPLIEQASWAAVEAFFDARDAEAGVLIGGGGSRPLGLDVVESFLTAYPFVRLFWNERGQIACHLIDYTDSDPDAAAWLVADREAEPGTFRFEPGDRKEVFNRVEVPYLFSDVEGEFLAQHEAHDVDSIEDPLALVAPSVWSQARYDRST